MAIKRRLWRWGRWLYFLAFQRHRYGHVALEHIKGQSFVVLPEVFNPAIFVSGVFLAESLPDVSGKTVLDMGTGSGIGAVFAALKGASVTAADINPHALRCAKINALLNRVDQHICCVESDVFSALSGQTFDLILFNPPFYRGPPRDWLDHAWRGVDVVERFAAGLPAMLNATGYALIVLSTDGETGAFMALFHAAGLMVDIHAVYDAGNELLTVYRVSLAV